ncbi:MAG: TolC family protein [Desulfosarcinaceae bacterium]|jgi:outer membrane protein TolC
MRLDTSPLHWISAFDLARLWYTGARLIGFRLLGLICLIMLTFGGTELQAQTLAEFQELAVANREAVAAARTRLAQSRLDVKIGKSPFLPSLDLGYTANRLDEDTTFENERNSQLGGTLSINLFSGFRDRYQLNSAEQIQLARRYELQTVIEDLKLEVAVRYLAIFADRQTLAVAEDRLSLLKKRYEDAQHRNAVGLIKRNDVLKIKVEMDDAYLVREKASADYQKSVNLLAYTIGAEVDETTLDFSELDTLPVLKDKESYRRRMLAQRSEIRALEMVVAARKETAKAKRAAYYPSLNFSAGYRHYGDDYLWGMTTEDGSEAEMRLQARVDLNIFDGFKKDHTLKRAKLDIRQARLDLAELKQLLATTLDNALLDYEVSLKNISVARTGIDQAEESLRVVELSFEEGVETATEVLDAIYLLSRAKLNFISAKRTVFLNYYRILRTIEDFDFTK